MTKIHINFPQTEKLIADGLDLVQQLLEQISAEAEALAVRAEPEILAELANNKKQLVEQLEQFNRLLNNSLALEKLPSTDEGIQTYLQLAQSAGIAVEQTSSDWQQIKALSAECRKLNDQNGMSINLLMLHTQRALQILKGQPQTTNTYGRDGTSQSNTVMRSLLSV